MDRECSSSTAQRKGAWVFYYRGSPGLFYLEFYLAHAFTDDGGGVGLLIYIARHRANNIFNNISIIYCTGGCVMVS